MQFNYNNKYNIPIPNENPISKATNIAMSIRQRTMGIGRTIIDTNYYWLRNNKEVIKREINKTSDDMKTILNNLLSNKKISLSNYCKLLKKLLKYLIKYPNINIWAENKMYFHLINILRIYSKSYTPFLFNIGIKPNHVTISNIFFRIFILTR